MIFLLVLAAERSDRPKCVQALMHQRFDDLARMLIDVDPHRSVSVAEQSIGSDAVGFLLVNADDFDVQVTDLDVVWNGDHGTAGLLVML